MYARVRQSISKDVRFFERCLNRLFNQFNYILSPSNYTKSLYLFWMLHKSSALDCGQIFQLWDTRLLETLSTMLHLTVLLSLCCMRDETYDSPIFIFQLEWIRITKCKQLSWFDLHDKNQCILIEKWFSRQTNLNSYFAKLSHKRMQQHWSMLLFDLHTPILSNFNL